VSSVSSTDGLELFEQDHWSDDQKSKAGVVRDLVKLLLMDRDFDRFSAQFADHPYTQHNRLVGTGIDPLLQFTKLLMRVSPTFAADVKHVHIDGDFVLMRWHAVMKARHRGNDKKGLIIVDTWRIENGIIVEHWDAIQPLSLGLRFVFMLAGGGVRNNNGVF